MLLGSGSGWHVSGHCYCLADKMLTTPPTWWLEQTASVDLVASPPSLRLYVFTECGGDAAMAGQHGWFRAVVICDDTRLGAPGQG